MQVGLQDGYGSAVETADRTALYFGALLRCLGRIRSRVAPTALMPNADWIEDCLGDAGNAEPSNKERIVRLLNRESSDSWIVDFAETIASGEQRAASGSEDAENPNANLKRIFNCVNGHSDENEIEHLPYDQILQTVQDMLPQVSLTLDGVNGLSDLLEDTIGAVPSSADPNGLIDVSLFDYAKATACFATCTQEYVASLDRERKAALLADGGSPELFEEPMFLLLSCDISGIQSFIYNVSGSKALRQLRARSLYLELMLEVVIDELLARMGMRRPNLQYSGGGHCYLLFANTAQCKTAIKTCLDEVADWLLDQFGIDLFLAGGWVECSAYDLMNHPQGRGYASLYRNLSRKLSDKKASRYSASVLYELNYGASKQIPGERECTECHRSDRDINGDGKCSFCAALGEIARDLAHKDVFAVAFKSDDSDAVGEWGLELPFGYQLLFPTRYQELKLDETVVRAYEKNSRGRYNGSMIRLWVADYCADMGSEGISTYEKSSVTLASESGIERLGVIRTDVDNLGTTFVSGIPEDKLSFSRSTVLSRSISHFFKVKINEILKDKDYQAQIIYAGGDDLFIIGNWSDILSAAIDIRAALSEFTGNDALTISAGIGMFNAKYPIARIASEVGRLEDAAKLFSVEKDGIQTTKNAIALWSADNVFAWDEFMHDVVERKDELEEAFADNEKGASFVYKLLDLLRSFDDVSSAPRLAYLLARSFEDASKEAKDKVNELYQWALDRDARRYFIAALEWYVYSMRKRS